ncbi:MAG: alpha/beta hydrolase [Alphaproteobacteria bacterium]|nr:alpha/beta hydrolase [Alphaproteobacteria bacterium]
MYPTTKIISLSTGKIACWDTEKPAPAVLFVHGNSTCKEVFIHQFESPALQDYRLVAIDLPGHGESDRVGDVAAQCTISRFAALIGEAIDILGLKNPLMVGWSLGGHIAIEMLGQDIKLAGLVISGTPPCGPGADDIGSAFIPSPHMALTGKAEFTDEEAQQYADHIYGRSVTAKLLQQVKHTQGAIRTAMMADFMVPGSAHGQKEVVATVNVPIAVLQGENDSFISLDYFDSLQWNRLWRHRVAVIKDAGHAPFLERPEEYNAVLLEFLKDLT